MLSLVSVTNCSHALLASPLPGRLSAKWRHPQNRKYITYCKVATWDWVTATDYMNRKFGEVRKCGAWELNCSMCWVKYELHAWDYVVLVQEIFILAIAHAFAPGQKCITPAPKFPTVVYTFGSECHTWKLWGFIRISVHFIAHANRRYISAIFLQDSWLDSRSAEDLDLRHSGIKDVDLFYLLKCNSYELNFRTYLLVLHQCTVLQIVCPYMHANIV